MNNSLLTKADNIIETTYYDILTSYKNDIQKILQENTLNIDNSELTSFINEVSENAEVKLEQVKQRVLNNLKSIIVENEELYNKLKSDKQLFVDYVQFLTELEILEEYGLVDFLWSAKLYIITTFILYYHVIKKRTLGKFINFVISVINRLSRYIYNKTKIRYYLRLFFKAYPAECIKFVQGVRNTDLNNIELIRKKFYEKAILPHGGVNNLLLVQQETALKCALEYFIRYVGIILATFYKCLYDNKQFMDLIKIKSKNIEIITNLKHYDIIDMTKLTQSTCYVHYQNFKDAYEMTINFIDIFYPGSSEKRSYFTNLLAKTIDEANKYAQQLLDEGKKEREKSKNSKNSQKK